MPPKKKYGSDERGAELTELLDTLESLLERTKILYEQYFMGIQKIPPSQLHKDIERKIRELTQEQIRNTALRFRLNTVTQKFGSYNTYWKRTLQAIEQGRYARDIQRAQRRAQRRGEDVPDELLVNMPKAMRDRIRRDRDRLAETNQELGADEEGLVYDSFPEDTDTEVDVDIQRILDGLDNETRAVPVRPQRNVHQISDEDDMLGDRIDELFAAMTDEAEAAIARPRPAPAPSKPAPSAPAQAAPGKPAQAAPSKPAQVAPGKPAQAAPAAPPPRPAAAPVPPRVVSAAPPLAVPDVSAPPAPPARTASATPPGVTPARPAPQPAAPSAVPPPPGMTEAETRVLYEQYRQARQLVGGEDISYDRLKRKLNEQAPRLMEQYNAKGLQYDVVVKDDKVVLKATPKATPKRE